MDRCEQCGFIFDEVPVADIPIRLRTSEAAYRAALLEEGAGDRPGPIAGPGPGTGPGTDAREAILRRRPQPDTWSALEYTCHVRDVLLVQRDRAVLALVETNPGFARMYRDERVSLTRYDAHPSAQVVLQLGVAAELCATVFEGLTPEQWNRPLIYNYPAPSPRDVAWLARNTMHEVEHHLGDIRSVITAVRPAGSDRER
jgi:S-DNA-T family DNA segregation ATPase FtsK/SpoIIIE